MVYFVNAKIWGLAITVTENEVRDYLAREIKDSDPVVKPLILDPDTGSKETTITFKSKNKKAGKRAIQALKDRSTPLVDSAGSQSEPGISSSCLDLTTLSRIDEEPTFDICFVHGLGGHALKTFSSKSRDHQKIKIWPRDMLPDVLNTGKHRGCYMTFGYNAALQGSDEIPQTLKDRAREMLDALITKRGNDCKRPIFFVCHSLGGLITCQAALLAFRDTTDSLPPTRFQEAFDSSGKCLIRGIIFFGTPFQGSKLANLGALLAKVFCLQGLVNTTTLSYLSITNKDVEDVVTDFERKTRELHIPLLTFYERKKMRFGPLKKVIVQQDSAKGIFDDRVPNKPLRADHTSMVKFDDAENDIFKFTVAADIKNLIHGVLNRKDQLDDLQEVTERPKIPKRSETSTHLTFQFQSSLPRYNVDKNTGPQKSPPSEQSPLFNSVAAGAYTLTENLLEDLNRHYRGLYTASSTATPGTCHWLLQNEKYKQWVAASNNTILFIEGGPGYGKSVLARFIIKTLSDTSAAKFENTPDESQPSVENEEAPSSNASRIIVYSLVQKVQGSKSPKSILMDILSQLAAIDARVIRDASLTLFRSIGKEVNVRFLWKLFTIFRRQSRRDIFCIVDGLDECIAEVKTERETTANGKMIDFLERVCKMLDEENSSNSRTKVLFTTRPKVEINLATQGRDVRMTINGSDLEPDLAEMVKKRVEELANGRDFPEANQKLMADEVIKKCSPIFQLAHQLLRQLGQRCDLGNRDDISREVGKFRSESLDNAYQGILEKIQWKYHGRAGRLIRILFFAQWNFSVEELQHALAVQIDDPSVDNFRARVSSGNLDFFMRGDCASLVKSDADDTVVLDHPSVGDFFQGLKSKRWPSFSCADAKRGHLHLALTCIKYLTQMADLVPTREEIDECDGNELWARISKASFAYYAAQYWTFHVRESGELITPYLDLVATLLGFKSGDTDSYIYMLFLRYMVKYAGDETPPKFNGMPPDNFLAANDLVYLLPIYYQPPEIKTNPLRKFFRKKKDPITNEKINMVDWKNRTVLHHACENGCFESVKYLLNCGAKGTVSDEDGQTPFSLAVEYDHREIAELLLSQDEASDRTDNPEKLTSLHYACNHGMEQVVNCLLANQKSPNAKAFDDWTPVHVAAAAGNPRVMALLLLAGGRPDAVKSNGATPLYLAASKGYLQIVRQLFIADNHLNPAPQTKEMQTPLYIAACNGHLDVFRELHEKEPNVPPDPVGYFPIHIAASKGHLAVVQYLRDSPTLHSETKWGRQPIHLAAGNGHLDVVRFLVTQMNIDPNSVCDDLTIDEDKPMVKTITPIFLAAADGHNEVVKFLLNNSVKLDSMDSAGRTILHQVARNGGCEIMKTLVSKGLDPLAKDKNGMTPFHAAAINGQKAVIEMYIEGGFGNAIADRFQIDETDNAKSTAFLLAVSEGRTEAAMLLLAHGANPHLCDKHGLSSIIFAAEQESPLVFEKLIEKNIDVRAASIGGFTALHVAARRGYTNRVQLLLDKMADPNVTTETGETPLIEAAQHFQKDAFELLLKCTKDPINQRDNRGCNAIDYVRDRPMFSECLTDWKDKDIILETSERQQILYGTVRQYLAKFPLLPGEEYQEKGLLGILGQCFLRLGDEQAAQTCLEKRIYRLKSGLPMSDTWYCDKCFKIELYGPVRLCTVCPDSLVCNDCHENSNGGRPKGCSAEHKQLILGGESWKKLKGKEVNEKGQSFQEWIDEQKEKIPGPNNDMQGSAVNKTSPPTSPTATKEPTRPLDIESSFQKDRNTSSTEAGPTEIKTPAAPNGTLPGTTKRGSLPRASTWEGKITTRGSTWPVSKHDKLLEVENLSDTTN